MESLFLSACEEGSASLVSKFIRKSLDIDCTDSTGCTGLMKACLNQHYEIIKMLIEANADINRKDFYGQNALHYAVRSNNEKICKLLCVNKIDSNEQNKLTQVLARDYALKGVSETKLKFSEIDYLVQGRNIKRSEERGFVKDALEPKTNEDKIYNLILRYDDMNLSDLESDGDNQQHGDVYTKSKKKKREKRPKKENLKVEREKKKKK